MRCSPTGSIAGARLARGKQPADRMHHGQRRGPRRKREQQRMSRSRSASPATRSDRVFGAIVDQRIHGDHMVEVAVSRARACRRTRNSMLPAPCSMRRAERARPISVGDRSTATTSAPRRAASTAKAPVPQPASSKRRPRKSAGSQSSRVCAHLVAPGAHRGANAIDRRIRRQPRPGIDRRAVEVIFELAATFGVSMLVIGAVRISRSPEDRRYRGP